LEFSRKDPLNEIVALRASLFDANTRLPAYGACFERLKTMAEDRFLGVVLLQISDLERLESVFGFERYESILKQAAFHIQDLNDREFGGRLLVSQRGIFDDQFCVFAPYALLSDGALMSLERIARRLYGALEGELAGADLPGLTLNMGYSVLHYNPFLRFERQVHRAIEETAALAQRQEETELMLHELELRQILARKAIASVFQPIVDLQTMEVLGYEALARGPSGTPYEWPEALFTFARQSRLSRQLDNLCKWAALSAAAGKPPGTKVFINPLPTTLDDPDFKGEAARESLARHGLTPREVVWELTERHAIEDYDAFRAVMEEYTAQGFEVALDDLGTGYSSIQTITHVRPLYLKVDVSLVKGIHQNLLKQELVSSLLILGRNINAQLIAEGIETREELETLRKLKVPYGQGYLLARPSFAFPTRIELPSPIP